MLKLLLYISISNYYLAFLSSCRPLVEMTLPAMRINNSNTTNHHNNCGDEEEESQFSDIAAGSSEHILWGYQGSSDMVYCHLSRCSILDSNNNSNISNNGNNHNNNSNNHTSVGVYAGDDTAVHGITGVKGKYVCILTITTLLYCYMFEHHFQIYLNSLCCL